MSHNPVVIRQAHSHELAILERVRNVSAQFGCGAVYSAEQMSAWLARPLPSKMLSLIELGCVLVAESSDEIVGYGALDPKTSEVEAVFVVPTIAGQGVGHTILRKVEMLASEHGITALKLSASLNALGFYRRAGYHSISQGKLPLNDHVFLEYEHMEKVL